jgi:hypothetical protein
MSPGAADLLVAVEQALSPVSGRFRDVDGAGVPGLDVQLDSIQGGDGPSEPGQRLQRAGRDAAASMQRRNRVARRRTACRQVPKPQSDRTNGLVGLGIGDGERKSLSFGELAALPPDPRQGLLGGGLRGQAADEGDVRVVPKLDSQVGVLVGELTQNDTTVGRWCGRPGRQLRCHVSIVAVVSVPRRPMLTGVDPVWWTPKMRALPSRWESDATTTPVLSAGVQG